MSIFGFTKVTNSENYSLIIQNRLKKKPTGNKKNKKNMLILYCDDNKKSTDIRLLIRFLPLHG